MVGVNQSFDFYNFRDQLLLRVAALDSVRRGRLAGAE